MATMITMITYSLFLAGSHRPTRRKPRRTSLDVLGKFVRLSPRIPYLHSYSHSNRPLPMPVSNTLCRFSGVGVPLSLPRLSRGFWPGRALFPVCCILRIHYTQGTTFPFATYSKWYSPTDTPRRRPPLDTFRQGAGGYASSLNSNYTSLVLCPTFSPISA